MQTKLLPDVDFYRARRAKPGQATLKTQLLEQLRDAERDVTHFIIAGSAGDKDASAARALADLERHRIAQILLSITKD